MIFYQGWLEITQCLGGFSVHNAWEGLKDQDHSCLLARNNSSNSWKSNSIFGYDCMMTMFLIGRRVIESLNLKTNSICCRNERLSRKSPWEKKKKKKLQREKARLSAEWRWRSRKWDVFDARPGGDRVEKEVFLEEFICCRHPSSLRGAQSSVTSITPALLSLHFVLGLFFFLWQLSGVQKAVFQNTLCLQIISLGGEKNKTFYVHWGGFSSSSDHLFISFM